MHSATVDADGAYATAFAMGASGRLRALQVADGLHAEQTSSAITIQVLPALTLSASPRRLAAGETATLTATADPVTQTRGRILVHRRARGRWRLVDKHRVALQSGYYEEPFTPPRPGRYRITYQSGGATVRVSVRASASR